MTDFTVTEAKIWHCGAMARLLRVEHQRVVAKIGFDSHKELRARFESSTFRRAWMIDGRLAALGGVTGTRLSPEGYVWLAFSDAATRHKVEMVKEARRQLAEIGETRHRLVTTILAGDDAAKRFAVFLGFVPDDGMHDRAASRFGRREVLRRADAAAGAQGVVMLFEPREAA